MTILLIEPALTFAQFMKLNLMRLGYNVRHVTCAENIREAVVRYAPDLVISEVVLGAQNGVDVCRFLRDDIHLAHLPVILISTDGCMATRQAAQEAGCVDFLTKPVTSRDIHELMQRHLPFHHKRHNIRVRMEMMITINDGRASRKQKVVSMGEGGLYIETDGQCPAGTRLDLDIPLPGLSSSLRLQGEVIYVRGTGDAELPQGMGIKFIGMDHNTTTLLKHYMESYLSDSLPVPTACLKEKR
ncbi:MAG: response regulator [Desulfuromonadales bacterium]